MTDRVEKLATFFLLDLCHEIPISIWFCFPSVFFLLLFFFSFWSFHDESNEAIALIIPSFPAKIDGRKFRFDLKVINQSHSFLVVWKKKRKNGKENKKERESGRVDKSETINYANSNVARNIGGQSSELARLALVHRNSTSRRTDVGSIRETENDLSFPAIIVLRTIRFYEEREW